MPRALVLVRARICTYFDVALVDKQPQEFVGREPATLADKTSMTFFVNQERDTISSYGLSSCFQEQDTIKS